MMPHARASPPAGPGRAVGVGVAWRGEARRGEASDLGRVGASETFVGVSVRLLG
jgi:hypothetical protein